MRSGWILFAVFVTGTASYYLTEISQWMRPELTTAAPATAAGLSRAADLAHAHLDAEAKDARTWFIGLPTHSHPVIDLFWRGKPGTPPSRAMLDPISGKPIQVRETRGGDFLYRFHFELSMAPLWGRWIVGICAMVMLVALVSGIVTRRRIFADFFTFRRRRTQRGWLDAHNVSGVLALPFYLMITYTGLVTLAVMYMPWGIKTAYKGDSQAFFAESGQITATRKPSGRPGQLAPLGPMVEKALALNGQVLERLTVQNPGDANATVVAVFEEPHGLMHRHPQVAFDGTTGTVVETLGALKPAAGTFATMVGLHEAHFAGPALRLLFFASGLLGCAMVATGLVLWTVARLPKPGERAFLGLRLVETLNIGTIAGLPAGIAAYFLANRLLPVSLADRADWEVRSFFAAWAAIALLAATLPNIRRWQNALSLVSVLFTTVLFVDLATNHRYFERFFFIFDSFMLVIAVLLGIGSRMLRRENASLDSCSGRSDRAGVTASVRQ